jgi:hypothetical protein
MTMADLETIAAAVSSGIKTAAAAPLPAPVTGGAAVLESVKPFLLPVGVAALVWLTQNLVMPKTVGRLIKNGPRRRRYSRRG